MSNLHLKPKKTWQQITSPHDPRLQRSLCCQHPVEARTTTDQHSSRIVEASNHRNRGNLITPDSEGYIYGYCTKCSEAVLRMGLAKREDPRSLKAIGAAIVEVLDYPVVGEVQ